MNLIIKSVFIAVVLLAGCNDSKPAKLQPYEPAWEDRNKPNVRFPGPWIETYNIDIASTLAKKNITGCGDFHYRVAYNSTSEFLVACTRDGKTWLAYTVFPNIGTVLPMLGRSDMPATPR